MNKPKPCAYCGGNCIINFIKGEYTLNCDSCPAKLEWFATTTDALNAWNTRSNNCDEISYFENGVALAIDVLDKHKKLAEAAGGKECAAYLVLGGIIDEIETQLEYAIRA